MPFCFAVAELRRDRRRSACFKVAWESINISRWSLVVGRSRRLAWTGQKPVTRDLATSGACLQDSSKKLARLVAAFGRGATIMPFDSRPRSLRGARLATITTLRPMSASGS